MLGINIFSGESGLGGALTNPTELSRQKGSIFTWYSITFKGRYWPDVETAYQSLKDKDAAANDALMIELIAEKFRQHLQLREQVEKAGGRAFLENCSHFTGARSESAKDWEGRGLQSRFIRNLVAGFDCSVNDKPSARGQYTLF